MGVENKDRIKWRNEGFKSHGMPITVWLLEFADNSDLEDSSTAVFMSRLLVAAFGLGILGIPEAIVACLNGVRRYYLDQNKKD